MGDPDGVRSRVDILLRADEGNEPATIRAMQQLFSMCRSKTKEHLANQAAAADAGGVRALLRLVDVGSMKQRYTHCSSLLVVPRLIAYRLLHRMWAFNTLGRLCFDHAENAAEVCNSGVRWQPSLLSSRPHRLCAGARRRSKFRWRTCWAASRPSCLRVQAMQT